MGNTQIKLENDNIIRVSGCQTHEQAVEYLTKLCLEREKEPSYSPEQVHAMLQNQKEFLRINGYYK